MALRYGYFDSDIVGVDDEGMPIFDRAETSDLFALLFASLISDGVLASPSTCFQVRAVGDGLNIELAPGFGMVKGHFCYNDEVFPMSLEAAPQKYSRIDRVVMRCNYLERMVEIIIKHGEEAAVPVPPELVRPSAGDYYELCLANIRLTAGQTLLTQSGITDTRADSSVCGYITQLIDHLDTSVFFAQFEQFYAEFVERADGSYGQFVKDMQDYLDNLADSGNSQLGEIVETLTEFEENSELQWQEWFDRIKQSLEATENGAMLSKILSLINDLYGIATAVDIYAIVDGTYVDDNDNESGIFESCTDQDIYAIVDGTYVDSEDSESEVE